MSSYQEFFKKKRHQTNAKEQAIQKKKPSLRQTKNHLWMVCISFALAGGSIWYLCGGEQTANRLFNKVEISFFGEANAETHGEEAKPASEAKPAKSAETDPKSEEKEATGAEPEKPVAKPAQKTWTTEDITLFTKLEARKKQLDVKEAELAKLEEELQKQKLELEKRLGALEEVRNKIAAKLEDKVKVDQQKVEALVSVYTNMKPVQAAKVIESINEDLAVEILVKMKNKSAAEILNLMDFEKAKKLSERYAGFREPAVAR